MIGLSYSFFSTLKVLEGSFPDYHHTKTDKRLFANKRTVLRLRSEPWLHFYPGDLPLSMTIDGFFSLLRLDGYLCYLSILINLWHYGLRYVFILGSNRIPLVLKKRERKICMSFYHSDTTLSFYTPLLREQKEILLKMYSLPPSIFY